MTNNQQNWNQREREREREREIFYVKKSQTHWLGFIYE